MNLVVFLTKLNTETVFKSIIKQVKSSGRVNARITASLYLLQIFLYYWRYSYTQHFIGWVLSGFFEYNFVDRTFSLLNLLGENFQLANNRILWGLNIFYCQTPSNSLVRKIGVLQIPSKFLVKRLGVDFVFTLSQSQS